MNITAKELSGMHIGKTVTIETARWGTHTGTLTSIIESYGRASGAVINNTTHVPLEHPRTPITIQEGE